MTTQEDTQQPSALPVTLGDFTIPLDCKRIFISAELEPANGDPRIQPTGFPDLGPVMYADPSEKHGLLCLIESEASMANRLEEVCLANKFEGTLRSELGLLPYIKLTRDGTPAGEFVTASTIDGHRFASEYIMGGHIAADGPELSAAQSLKKTVAEKSAPKKASGKKKADAAKDPDKEPSVGKPEFVRFVQSFMGMTESNRCPAANVPRMFRLAMEYDPLSLLHGFQISVKDKLTFVGLRSPRAITGSILGINCQRITVPGVRFDPIGTGDAGQAIFQKQRISAKSIEARFSVDVGLLASMKLGETPEQHALRLKLLLNIALCKIAWFLHALNSGVRLRTDCDLRLAGNNVHYWIDRITGQGKKFDIASIVTSATGIATMVAQSGLHGPQICRSPFLLKYVQKEKLAAAKPNAQVPDPEGEAEAEEQDEAEATEED